MVYSSKQVKASGRGKVVTFCAKNSQKRTSGQV